MSVVLVSGGSGFVGSHCILRLLRDGHEVRTTIRNLKRADDVRAMIRAGGVEPGDALSFFEADLMHDARWFDAVAGCDYVLHVASPLPTSVPRHEDELIVPAREGTLRILRAARDSGVKRVVYTSSFATIGYGHPLREEPFDETSWTNLDGDDVYPYVKSKTLAERAAWDFVADTGGDLELATVHPVAILGPVLGPDYAISVHTVQFLMNGKMPGCPKFYLGIVDVRDVADLHLRAMIDPKAKGERFLATAGDFVSIREVAEVLKARFGHKARRVRTWELPNWTVRLGALIDPTVKQVLPELDKRKNATSEKARRLLGWDPLSNEDCIVATAEGLQRFGLLRD